MGGGTKKDLTGAKGAIGDEVMAPIGSDGVQFIPVKDDSETIRCAERGALVEALTRAIEAPTLFGDLVLARVVAQLLVRILGPTDDGAATIELRRWVAHAKASR